MTRVDFYLLRDSHSLARQRFACRMAEKAYRLGHRVHLHAESPTSSRQLDELLWTYRDGSFVPHEIDPADPELCPVSIGHSEAPMQTNDVLINLASAVPGFFSRFERVAEILGADPNSLEVGRERYRFYRDRGYALKHHEIDAA
jgi:DNA polymerase-3 subunit chi